MKILHTSDWHLGKMLYTRSRHEEHARFLEHLCGVLQAEQVRVLLICGDVFDTLSPSCRSQGLYYGFLARIAGLQTLDDVVIIAGNHDSAHFLNASSLLLSHLRIHVVSSAAADAEPLTLRGRSGRPYLIVAAVPYLRDRDVRTAVFGESAEERCMRYRQGVDEYYRSMASRARAAARQDGGCLPVIATGHLFAAGCRPLQAERGPAPVVGTLEAVPAETFDECFAYTALGHLHGAQTVGGRHNVRYCGSPLPLSFAEIRSAKKMVLVELDDDGGSDTAACPARIRELDLPCFQELCVVSGDADAIVAGLRELIAAARPVWVEVSYTSSAPPAGLDERIRDLVENTAVSVLAIRIRSPEAAGSAAAGGGMEHPEHLEPDEVFRGFLEQEQVPAEDREGYVGTFNELRDALATREERSAGGS